MALELLAGTGFKMLYDGVKQAVRTRGKHQTLLRGLESTLDSLQEKVIQQIGEFNVELGLPNEEIESLQMEMEDGAKLVAQLAELPWWRICGRWDAYRQQIDDLDRALKGLLTQLNLQGLRDMKELLALSRDNRDNLYRLNRSVLNIQTAVRERAGDWKEAEYSDLCDYPDFIDLVGGQVESTNLSKQERFDGVVGFESVDGWNPFKVKGTVGYHGPFFDRPSSSGVKETCGRAGDNQMLAHISTVAMKVIRSAEFVNSGCISQLQEVGEGSFGTVYKALLDGGQVVSIKRAEKVLFQHLQPDREFKLLSKIDHCNLAKLLGYFDEGNERLIITEYVANGTLREHLDVKYGKILEFNQRLEIAIDVARGLTYLHVYPGRQIIHRDVNSSSILLTENMRAKVADFGFSTKAKGTIGYTDPEYGETGQLTPKCDVYSFGILLIEATTGRRPVELKRPVEERVTLEWASKKFNEGKVMELVDPSMKEVVEAELLVKTFDLAIQCAARVGADRPDMYSVGVQLQKLREDYLGSVKRG